MNYFKVLTLLFLFAFCGSISAQNQQLKKADKFYKMNEYSQAISFYEQGLQEEENLPAKTKLAYCYMMTNNLNNAEQLYGEIVHEERARPITKYYYGETLMNNGKYDEAKNWFLKYAELNPNDERALKMVAACDKVNSLKPMFENITIKPFPQNSKSDDSGPVFYRDGIVFTSDRNSGVNPLKQKTGRTGRDYLRIFYSEADSTGAFEKPEVFSKKLNEINKHCGPLSFSKEQNFVVFTRTGTNAGKNDTYNMQLYSSTSNDGTKWKKPKVLGFCKKDHNYMHPALSTDGKTLYFVSDKPGGEGGTDIYRSRMTEKGWSTPLNLGTKVNTSFSEGFPFVEDNKLYFSSKGHAGFGGFDIFMVQHDEKGLWSTPRNIGEPINSSFDDISLHINETFTKGAFTSSREGNDDNIYIFDITSETIVNTEIETPEGTYVREALQPTTRNEKSISVEEVVMDEEPIDNQLKNETRNDDNNGTVTDAVVGATSTTIIAGTANESEEIIETKNTEILNIEGSEESIEETVVENEEVAETIEVVSVESESIENISDENTAIQETIETEEIDEVSYENERVQENIEVVNEAEVVKSNVEIIEENVEDENQVTQATSTIESTVEELFNNRPMPTVFPFVQIKYLLKKGIDVRGKTFRINGVQFDKGQYIITPEIALKLNLLVDILEKYPDLQVEIAAHSSSIGDDIENLEVSRARAGAIAAHLVNRGIDGNRLNAEGYGENRLLNNCSNGVNCSGKEHNVNERIELAIF